ncbi:unnamed protein product, partial [Choristocarpus tenellus]
MEEDAERQRALRATKSIQHDFVLVLVGAAVANLEPKKLAKIVGMEGARWVSRYELSEPSSLPLEVRPELAKLLVERLPCCTTVEDIESGHEFLLLLTFPSAEAKLAAIAHLGELGLDTSEFDTSASIQVERLLLLSSRVLPPPLPPPPPPPASP